MCGRGAAGGSLPFKEGLASSTLTRSASVGWVAIKCENKDRLSVKKSLGKTIYSYVVDNVLDTNVD